MTTAQIVLTKRCLTYSDLLQFPQHLSSRIRETYSRIDSDGAEIVSRLPDALRVETTLFLYKDTIAKLPFFDKKPNSLISELIAAMRTEIQSTGDFVAVQGERFTCMHFVSKGTLSVVRFDTQPCLSSERAGFSSCVCWAIYYVLLAYILISDNHTLAVRTILSCSIVFDQGSDSTIFVGLGTLRWEDSYSIPSQTLGYIVSGMHIGEYSCMSMEVRKESILAMTHCELLTLPREALIAAVERWPCCFSSRAQRTVKKLRCPRFCTKLGLRSN